MQVKRECICIKGGAWIELACIPQAFTWRVGYSNGYFKMSKDLNLNCQALIVKIAISKNCFELFSECFNLKLGAMSFLFERFDFCIEGGVCRYLNS
jgi:hypothetical protein